MERAQAPTAPTASTLDVKARDDIDRPLKPRNPDLYYGNLYIECYYFCQQCKNYVKVARSLSHNRIPFTVGFLKNRILNW